MFCSWLIFKKKHARVDNVLMACVKIRLKDRKHSIRSNLLFGPKLPSWHVTLSTSFSKNKYIYIIATTKVLSFF